MRKYQLGSLKLTFNKHCWERESLSTSSVSQEMCLFVFLLSSGSWTHHLLWLRASYAWSLWPHHLSILYSVASCSPNVSSAKRWCQNMLLGENVPWSNKVGKHCLHAVPASPSKSFSACIESLTMLRSPVMKKP